MIAPTLEIIAMYDDVLRRECRAALAGTSDTCPACRARRSSSSSSSRRGTGTASSATTIARPRCDQLSLLASAPRPPTPSRPAARRRASSAGSPPMKNIGRQPQCGNTKKVAHGGQQIAASRSPPAASPESMPRRCARRLLHRERRADAPLAAHADAEQRAQNEERRSSSARGRTRPRRSRRRRGRSSAAGVGRSGPPSVRR